MVFFKREFAKSEDNFLLLDVFGKAVHSDNLVFVACAIDAEFDVPAFSSSYCRSDALPVQATTWVLHEIIDENSATVFWGTARICKLFHFLPNFSVRSKSYVEQPFLAVDTSAVDLRTTPFLWTNADGHEHDYYHSYPMGGARLAFMPKTPQSEREKIAVKFWDLLLLDVNGTHSYLQEMDEGRFAYDSNRGSRVSIPELEIDDDGFDVHQISNSHCHDCNGTGEEYIKYPIRQTCKTCGGTGWVTWGPSLIEIEGYYFK